MDGDMQHRVLLIYFDGRIEGRVFSDAGDALDYYNNCDGNTPGLKEIVIEYGD